MSCTVVGILFTRSNCLRIQSHHPVKGTILSFRLQNFKGLRQELCDSGTQTGLRTFWLLFSMALPSLNQTAIIMPLTSQGL